MILAAEEAHLCELTQGSVDLVDPPVVHAPLTFEQARSALADLMQACLIWLYWDVDDVPDLTEAEAVEVINDPTWWGQDPPRFPSVYLTTRGESVLSGASSNDV